MVENDPTAQTPLAETPREGVDSVPPLDLAKHALEGAGLAESTEHDTDGAAPAPETPGQPPSTEKREISEEEAEKLARASETRVARDRLRNVQDLIHQQGSRRAPRGRSSGRRSRGR